MEAEYGLTQSAFGGNQDDALLVRFLKVTRENEAKSEAEGRPIHEEIDYIEIMTPGDKDNIICRPMRDVDKIRFPRHWEGYQARISPDDTIEGTLLEEWPQISRSEAEELKFFHVRTVEQLAMMSDANAQNFRGAATLKQKAQKFLDTSMSNDELSKQLKDAQAQITALVEAAKIPAEKPKRTRRSKEEMAKAQEA
jgi:hypothetical protein